MTPAANEDKPRLRLDSMRRGTGKWVCFSVYTSFYGGEHVRLGKGYSPAEAYGKWKRCRYPRK